MAPHVLMEKLVDIDTCMYPKWTSSLKILGVKVKCGPLTHNTSIYLSLKKKEAASLKQGQPPLDCKRVSARAPHWPA